MAFDTLTIPGLPAFGSSPKPTKDDVTLAVNGKKFEGWESVSVKRSIKAIAGAFQLSVVDKWAAEQTPFKIVPGDECVLSINKSSLITGYLDGVKPSFDENSRTIVISGRDKTGDMVDCSAVHTPGNWTNISLLRLANILGEPFDITATSLVTGLTPFANFAVQGAESAFECLDRAAKQKGVLLMNDGEGNILICRAGTTRASSNLEQGVNIKSASADYEMKERFSKYLVKGQAHGYEEETTPGVSFQASGIAYDEGVARYRPLTLISEGAATPAICKSRAQWEATVRAAKSSPISVTVQGWRQGDGSLWALNQLTKLKSSWLGVNQQFLITSVEFKKGSGTTTVLELERPDAYTPDPTLTSRKDPYRQLVLEDRARK